MISLKNTLSNSDYSNYYNGTSRSSGQKEAIKNIDQESIISKNNKDQLSDSLKSYLEESNNGDELKKKRLENRLGEVKNEIKISETKEDLQKDRAIKELQNIERQVIAHEMAHMSSGGKFAGAPTYSYQQGPDGKRYIVGGEVSISIQSGKTPEETMRNARQVKAAAMAPANPSPADISVAAQASAMEAKASMELSQKMSEQMSGSQKTDEPDQVTGENLENNNLSEDINNQNTIQNIINDEETNMFENNNLNSSSLNKSKTNSEEISDEINLNQTKVNNKADDLYEINETKSDENDFYSKEIQQYINNNDLQNMLGSKISIIA